MRRTDDRSRIDRARSKAVLGVGAGGGCLLPQWGFGGVTPEKFFEFHIAVDEFLCIFMDQKSDETSKGISQEAISICHFPTICLSSYIYVVSVHSLSSVRGVEWCRTMGDTRRTDDLDRFGCILTVQGWFEEGRPSCNGGPGITTEYFVESTLRM